MKARLEHLLHLLRRDPKRAAVLAILVVLAAVLYVQMRKSLPVPAAATQVVPDEEAGFGSSAIPDIGRGAELARIWRREPVPHLSRNLFVSRLTLPPAPSAPADQSRKSEEEGLFWRQLERAMASRADREQYRRTLGEAAKQDAWALQVTSIVIGPDNTALVGEKLVKRGDVVPGGERGSFTIVEIESNRVVLARDGYRVVLRLGRAGAELVAD